MYWVVTSKKKERILVTKSLNEIYDFVTKNLDSKIRSIDHSAKCKIVDRRFFLRTFYNSSKKEAIDREKLFNLVSIMIKGETNKIYFLRSLNLKNQYQEFLEITQKRI